MGSGLGAASWFGLGQAASRWHRMGPKDLEVGSRALPTTVGWGSEGPHPGDGGGPVLSAPAQHSLGSPGGPLVGSARILPAVTLFSFWVH